MSPFADKRTGRLENYGCVKCQRRHYSGEALYEEHRCHQSKHGFQHSAQYEPHRPAHLRTATEEVAA